MSRTERDTLWFTLLVIPDALWPSPVARAAGLSVCLTVILAYAAFHQGGVQFKDWTVCLLALTVLSLGRFLWIHPSGFAPALERELRWPALLLLVYVAFQLFPMPRSLVAMLSPGHPSSPNDGSVGLISLSVAPATTLMYLLRILGYTIVFLLSREITWNLSPRLWATALPIATIGSLEGALGVIQHIARGPESFALGTYLDHSHFAGLLEMALPFAATYPAVILLSGSSRERLSLASPLKVGLSIIAAIVIFLGIVYSFSRMALVASVGSLILMLAIGFGLNLPRTKRWCAIGLLTAAVLFSIGLLTPHQQIPRFSRISTLEGLKADTQVWLWRDTLHLIASYPLVGCGAGAYAVALQRCDACETHTALYADNDYLQLLAELGAVGFVIGSMVILAIYRRALRHALTHPELTRRCLALACTGSITSVLIHSTVESQTHIPATAMLLSWIAGMTAGLSCSAVGSPGRVPSGPPR